LKYYTDEQEIARKMASAKALNEALTVKNVLYANGYKFQVSLYMAVYNSVDETYSYRRIEVLTNAWWDEKRWLTVRDFFKHFIPVKCYSIWYIDSQDNVVRFANEWD
jgi:hypothetical protein